jgi:hypothetical protein
MMYVLLALVAIAVWMFCLFDVLITDEDAVRKLSKFGWFMVVLLGLGAGALLWLAFGRPQRARVTADVRTGRAGTARSDAEAPRGPDDDPEFLRSLERRLRGDD